MLRLGHSPSQIAEAMDDPKVLFEDPGWETGGTHDAVTELYNKLKQSYSDAWKILVDLRKALSAADDSIPPNVIVQMKTNAESLIKVFSENAPLASKLRPSRAMAGGAGAPGGASPTDQAKVPATPPPLPPQQPQTPPPIPGRSPQTPPPAPVPQPPPAQPQNRPGLSLIDKLRRRRGGA